MTLLALLLGLVAGSLAQELVPPNILEPARAYTKYYSFSEEVVIKCRAQGVPVPTYEWRKNMAPLGSQGSATYDSSTGDLTFSKFSEVDDGEYMCVAKNNRGQAASFSPIVTLAQARVELFQDALTPQDWKGTQYSYIMLPCATKGEVVGDKIAYNWYLSDTSSQVQLDGGRIYIDTDGNMHFTYLKTEDTTPSGTTYRCGIGNEKSPAIPLGKQNTLTVEEKSPAAIKPLLEYSNSGVIVKRFNTVTLECVFMGYDPQPPHLPIIAWEDPNKKTITSNPDKYTLTDDRRRLTVSNVQENEEGNYNCYARNSEGESAKNAVFLNVTSPPIWWDHGQPRDQTVPEGLDVSFNCSARSAMGEDEPESPVWYINGRKTGSHTDRSKYEISTDQKKMVIRKVEKSKDVGCVQCMVENSIGQTWGDGCLTVIIPIAITRAPKLRQEITQGDTVDLTVHATTDDSLTLSYLWQFKNETTADTPPHVTHDIITDNFYINTSQLSDEEYRTIGGVYRRLIFHNFENREVDIEVVLADKPPEPVVAAAGFDMWIIGLIIGIIFLIIVVIIIIFIICRKQQEGDYNVGKKETGAGLDPEKELKDNGFNDYSRPDYDDFEFPDKKPHGDLEYDDVPIGGDDESLGEYGEEEGTYFNEDGSFIGVYQKKEGPRPTKATESTI